MGYTLAVFTATMMSAAQAFGQWGPIMLYSFMCCYSAAHSQPQTKRKSKRAAKKSETAEAAVPTVSWTEEAMRNPFCDEHSMTFVRSLLTEGDQKRLSKEERARIVFQLMTKGRNHISKEQLAAVLY